MGRACPPIVKLALRVGRCQLATQLQKQSQLADGKWTARAVHKERMNLLGQEPKMVVMVFRKEAQHEDDQA